MNLVTANVAAPLLTSVSAETDAKAEFATSGQGVFTAAFAHASIEVRSMLEIVEAVRAEEDDDGDDDEEEDDDDDEEEEVAREGVISEGGSTESTTLYGPAIATVLLAAVSCGTDPLSDPLSDRERGYACVRVLV